MLDRIKRILNVTFGEGVSKGSNPDDLFDISTGYVTLEVEGYEGLNQAGLCFSQVDSRDFEEVVEEIEDLLSVSAPETGTDYDVVEDEYGYRWVVLRDPDFEDLVTTIHMSTDSLVAQGYAKQLLCAVFAFEKDDEVYWLYNFKRGKWYPFVPKEGKRERDNQHELKLRTLMSSELDIEEDETRWYPLWDVPF
ncbi:MAG: hypothetical protein SV377_00950 [Halobacteria archaeon]|nr:hypothetical protein [Halobacteria archaeon]